MNLGYKKEDHFWKKILGRKFIGTRLPRKMWGLVLHENLRPKDKI